jgi:hypothetical protein
MDGGVTHSYRCQWKGGLRYQIFLGAEGRGATPGGRPSAPSRAATPAGALGVVGRSGLEHGRLGSVSSGPFFAKLGVTAAQGGL